MFSKILYPFAKICLTVRVLKNATPEEMALYKAKGTTDEVKNAIVNQIVGRLYPEVA